MQPGTAEPKMYPLLKEPSWLSVSSDLMVIPYEHISFIYQEICVKNN